MKLFLETVTAFFITQFFYDASAAVTIVRSSGATPYETAAKAIVEKLEDSVDQIRSTDLATFSEDEKHLLQFSSGDIFVAIGTKAALYLGKYLPRDVALTYCMVANAEELKLSGAIRGTGVSTDVPLENQFQLISQTMPNIRSLGILYRLDDPKSRERMKAARSALLPKWKLRAINVAQYDSISDAIKKLCKQKIDMIWTQSDRSVFSPAVIRSLLLTSFREHIPVFGFSAPFVKSGALLGIGINSERQGKQVAEIVLRLVEQGIAQSETSSSIRKSMLEPDFEIAINLFVAENLSVKIPKSIIKKATYVYGGN